MALMLQSTSRESLAEAESGLDQRLDGMSGDDARGIGDDLFAVLRVVAEETGLRRHLADPAVSESSRAGLARALFDGKIGDSALELVSGLVSARWSSSVDLVEGIEALARRATLAVAEKDGSLDEVEDQLFRFGRIVDREPDLAAKLSDRTTTSDQRAGLLRDVLGDRVTPVTATLLEQTVRTPRGRAVDRAAEELSELAAHRRDRSVAHVATPVRLSAEQEERLTESLTRLYGRPISLQVELDPDLLGGLVVRVGGELIDGSVAGKLAAARRRLPG